MSSKRKKLSDLQLHEIVEHIKSNPDTFKGVGWVTAAAIIEAQLGFAVKGTQLSNRREFLAKATAVDINKPKTPPRQRALPLGDPPDERLESIEQTQREIRGRLDKVEEWLTAIFDHLARPAKAIHHDPVKAGDAPNLDGDGTGRTAV
jgi:hypothetical protein